MIFLFHLLNFCYSTGTNLNCDKSFIQTMQVLTGKG